MALTADEIFEEIGSFGRYQLYSLIISSVNMWFWYGWPALLMTFIAAEPAWRCIPNNSTECPLIGTMEPGDKDYNFRCNISRNAWEFVDDFTSVVTQFDLVCNNAIYGTVSSSLIFVGWCFGAMPIGTLADKFGRKIMVYISGFFVSLFSLLSAFPNVYWLFSLFRFVLGFFIGGFIGTQFVLVTELVGVKHRSLMGACFWCSSTLSCIVLAGTAYLVRDWRMMCILTGAPAIVALFGFLSCPESLRWLLINGKMEEARELCRTIARVNVKELPDEGLKIDTGIDAVTRLGDIRDLFKTRSLTKTTLMSCICWIANAMVYYGVYLSATGIGGNMYFNFFLSSVIELPAILAGIWIYNRFGRKKGVIVPMLLAAAGIAGAALFNTDDKSNKGLFAGKIFLSMIWAKFWITISMNGTYIYSAELFPTVVRNTGMSTSTSCGRIGSMLSPFIVFLARVNPLLPYGIMGIISLTAGLLCMLLPETRFKPTLENIDQEIQEDRFTKEIEKNVTPEASGNQEKTPLLFGKDV